MNNTRKINLGRLWTLSWFKEQSTLKHYGIKGQKWGVRRGPPYPLDREQKSDTLSGIGLQFFTNKGLKKLTSDQLRKGIRSLRKQIKKHERFLQNPEEHDLEWKHKDKVQKDGEMQHWRDEIHGYQTNIAQHIEELHARGEEYEE